MYKILFFCRNDDKISSISNWSNFYLLSIYSSINHKKSMLSFIHQENADESDALYSSEDRNQNE